MRIRRTGRGAWGPVLHEGDRRGSLTSNVASRRSRHSRGDSYEYGNRETGC